jgi:hypothetical protein
MTRQQGLAPLLLILLLSKVAGATPEELDPLLECAQANWPKSTSVQTVEFRSVDRVGNGRRIKAKVHWKRFEDGRSKVMLRVSEPADLKDSALLLIEKEDRADMFLFLPDLKKVKRVTSGMLSGSLFGSDFTYEDFMQLQGIGIGGRHEVMDDASIDGAVLQVVAHYPAADSGSAYQRVVSYWDRDACLLVRSEMWGRGESPRKVLSVDRSAVFTSNGVKLLQKLVMTDLRDETSTHLSIDAIEIDVDLPRKLFSTSGLGRN